MESISILRIRRKLDGMWMKVTGWGLWGPRVEWTKAEERAYVFNARGDFVARLAYERLLKAGDCWIEMDELVVK